MVHSAPHSHHAPGSRDAQESDGVYVVDDSVSKDILPATSTKSAATETSPISAMDEHRDNYQAVDSTESLPCASTRNARPCTPSNDCTPQCKDSTAIVVSMDHSTGLDVPCATFVTAVEVSYRLAEMLLVFLCTSRNTCLSTSAGVHASVYISNLMPILVHSAA